MKQCAGCGAILQNTQKNEIGYTTSLDNPYCQSCFRLRHYGDFTKVKARVDDGDTLSFIEDFKGHIFWIVDILRLTQSLHSGLIRALMDKDVVLLVNKNDLIPKSVSRNQLKHSIMRLLRDYDISLMDVLFVSSKQKGSLKSLYPYLNDAPCAFVGNINSGKSSLLNTLLNEDSLSVSPVSSTTADIVRIEKHGFVLYDTPGFVKESNLHTKLNDEMLQKLAPSKPLKPMVFQLYEKQALIIGNLGAIIITPKDKVTITSYLPISLKRIKPERVDQNLKLIHDFMILNPKYRSRNWPTNEKAIDLEIFDVGFITIKGQLSSLETILDETSEMILRKAVI